MLIYDMYGREKAFGGGEASNHAKAELTEMIGEGDMVRYDWIGSRVNASATQTPISPISQVDCIFIIPQNVSWEVIGYQILGCDRGHLELNLKKLIDGYYERGRPRLYNQH